MKKETKLTQEILWQLGFRGEGKSIIGKPLYRFKPPKGKYGHYHYQFQIELNDYPESNGNSGILSLYDPEIKDAHMHTSEKDTGQKKPTKVDHVQWKEHGHIGGIKYLTLSERQLHIAWSVTTLERFNKIYVGITGNPPLKLKKKK